jgi:hypothetical protein
VTSSEWQRSLWAQLPEANDEEKGQFGTLVFFNGLRHVGIVRDSKTFYQCITEPGRHPLDL